MSGPADPRQRRLKTEHGRLMKLNRESDYVRVKPVNQLPGSEPEQYQVTFLCRGIVGIQSDRSPIFGNRHEVHIRCDEEFPADAPRLRWETAIWHPNIQHEEPKNVCINKAEWLARMGLDDLCRQMFEMVQYKNYHAEWSQPYPLDQEVARWVREYAEPRGVVDKRTGRWVDDRPFTRPTVTPNVRTVQQSDAPPRSRIKLRSTRRIKVRSSDGGAATNPAPAVRRKVKIRKRPT